MITGVGAAYIDSPIYGLPTAKADEFISDGLGASYETDIDRMIVVSMGTGTSLVQCIGDDIRHIGGIGVGGGTLMGLSRIMLQTDDIHTINKLANEGNLKNIDVQIGDISPNPLPGLPKDATARHRAGHHHHRAADHRFDHHTLVAWQRHQGVCAHRQPHAAASVQDGVPLDGEAVWRAVHHPRVQRVLHSHRCRTGLREGKERQGVNL